MDIIKFRGLKLGGLEYVHGSLVVSTPTQFIIIQEVKYPSIHITGAYWNISAPAWVVDPESVGQFTNHLDVNGKEIYSGDKVKDKLGKTFLVKYNDFCAFMLYPVDDPENFMAFYPGIELELQP